MNKLCIRGSLVLTSVVEQPAIGFGGELVRTLTFVPKSVVGAQTMEITVKTDKVPTSTELTVGDVFNLHLWQES